MKNNNLIYTTPESVGISSSAIEAFVQTLVDKRLCMHGFMLLRHGKVAAEGYWPPFGADMLHRIYSVSKSFTGLAVGMMIDEGKLSLDSRPADIFAEYLPSDPHPFLLEATVRDLLVMATYNPGSSYNFNDSDFTETFFTIQKEKHKPGQIFNYDTAATTVLCAIVEKLVGKPMLEYMRPVLDEIGFSKDAWCVQTPEGRSWTGSGILCTMRDLARVGLLCIGIGEYNGKQLISREYMRAATSKQIETAVVEGSAEMSYGYGYQIWMMRDGGFAMNGMGGQHVLCMPKYGTILVTTADIQGHMGESDVIFSAYNALLETVVSEPLPENPQATASLNNLLSNLTIPLPTGSETSSVSAQISGRTYVLEQNNARIKWLRFTFEPQICRLQYENASGENELVFGMCKYEHQLFPEKYFGKRIGVRDTNYKCIAAAAWASDSTLTAILYAVDDYLGSIKFKFAFEGDEVCGHMTKAAERFFEEYQGFVAGKIVGCGA
jgi:CubicO group peptidase (beta-lactamase class C family)